MSPKSHNRSGLEDVLLNALSKRQSRSQLRQLTTVPLGAADFSSNNYLSLPTNPAIQRAFLAKLKQASATDSSSKSSRAITVPPINLLGSGGSRLLDGNSAQAEALEYSIAAFHHAPAGLLFNSAMEANVGLFSCVPQVGDVIIYDELIHASVHDGMRLSRAEQKIPFAHNQVYGREENSANSGRNKPLETILLGLQDGIDHADRHRNKLPRNVFVAVEGIYSMDGDVAPLAEIVECVERHLPRGNGYIIVDEAHSVGVLGDRGRGLVCQLGLEDRVWSRVIGFGKALGCSGGIVLCSATTRLYLINYARTLIYTTAMSFPSLVSIEATYNFLMSGQAEPLLNHLRHLIRYTYKLLCDLSTRLSGPSDLFHLPKTAWPRSGDGENTQKMAITPIIPIITSLPRSLAAHCQRKGFMVRPIVAPTVPKGEERVRICLHAANTTSEVDGLIRTMEEWVIVQLAFKAEEMVTERQEKNDSVAVVQGSDILSELTRTSHSITKPKL